MSDYGIYQSGIAWELYIEPDKACAFLTLEELVEKLNEL